MTRCAATRRAASLHDVLQLLQYTTRCNTSCCRQDAGDAMRHNVLQRDMLQTRHNASQRVGSCWNPFCVMLQQVVCRVATRCVELQRAVRNVPTRVSVFRSVATSTVVLQRIAAHHVGLQTLFRYCSATQRVASVCIAARRASARCSVLQHEVANVGAPLGPCTGYSRGTHGALTGYTVAIGGGAVRTLYLSRTVALSG